MQSLWGGTQRYDSWEAVKNEEMPAYVMGSYVNEAFNVRALFQLWNPSWKAADREKNREAAAKQAAIDEANRKFPK